MGILIAALSPLVSQIELAGDALDRSGLFRPELQLLQRFSLGIFLAFGMAAGSIFRLVKQEDMGKVMQWMMLIGIGLVMGGQYFSNLPYSVYTKVGVLAQQSRSCRRQTGSRVDADGGRLGLGEWRDCASLELVLPAWHYFACWSTGYILNWFMGAGSGFGRNR